MALIYIVEDDENIREIETIALKNSNYFVSAFEKAKDFYKKVEEIVPDLVILDVMLPDENGYEIVGICAKYKSDNVGHQVAVNNACNTYARSAGGHIRGRIVSDIASNGDDINVEFDKFYAAYETLIEKEIKGELVESYAIYRELGDGEKIMQIYFIVNEDAAAKARIRAFENALKESEAAQKYADKVSKFVNDGFEIKNL
mgnify:CR=1 FL=1